MERTLICTTLIATWTLLVVNGHNFYSTPVLVYKLPNYVKPISYRLWLVPQLAPSYNISGNVTITFMTAGGPQTDPIVDIFLSRHKSITVDEYSVQLVDSAGTKIGSVTHDDDSEVLRITTNTSLASSSVYTLSFKYAGAKVNREDVGFYVGTYKDSYQTVEYLATNFKPNYARLVFPCFDEPQFRATFTVSVARRSDQTTAFTTPLLNTSRPDPSINNMVWDTFETTPAVSVQSLSLFVSTMTPVPLPSCEPITLYARTDALYTGIKFNVFCQLVSILGIIMKTPYPLNKLSLVVLPSIRLHADGGLGVIYVSEEVVTIAMVETNGARLQELLLPSAKQVMKQYIGYYVTPSWWTDVWLSEAIATYMSYVTLIRFISEWNLQWHHTVANRQSAMSLDTTAYNSEPLVAKSIDMPYGVVDEYNDPLKSLKGSSLLTMIENGYAPPPILQTIQDLYNKSKDGLITTSDFVLHLKANLMLDDYNITTPDGGTTLDSWFYDDGYPVVNARRQSDGTIVLTQERFCGIQTQDCNKMDTTWNIPISYTKMGEDNFLVPRPTMWLSSGSQVIRDVPQDAWYIVNLLSTGYYRVNYDDANWLQLKQHSYLLNGTTNGKSSLVNKAQLIDDMMALAAQSSVSYTMALNFTLFVRDEKSYFPWYSAISAFSHLRTALYGRQGYDDFRKYMQYLVEKLYAHIGFDSVSRVITHDESLLRALIVPWACDLDVEDCRTQASHVADVFLQTRNLSGVVSGNVAEAAVCAGFQRASASQVTQLYNFYKTENRATEAHRLMVIGIGCSTNSQVHSIIFNQLLQKTTPIDIVNLKDAEAVLTVMYSLPENVDDVLNFITINADNLQELYGINTLSRLIAGISSKLNTKDQVNKLYNMISAFGATLDTAVIKTTNAATRKAEAVVNWLDKGAENNLRTALQAVNSETQPAPPSSATKPAAVSFTTSISIVLVLVMWKVALLH